MRCLMTLPLWLGLLAIPALGNLADDLLDRVPPDVGAALVVNDLRGHVQEMLNSPLAAGLMELPTVKTWMDDEGFRRFQKARREIEAALEVDLVALRDDVIGDAFVLSLHLAPDETPDQASGLLVSKVRDPALLQHVIALVNASERQSGQLVRVEGQHHQGHEYSQRLFRDPARPDEFYALLPGDLFVWTNAERLIQGVMERSNGNGNGDRKSLGSDPRLLKARAALPERPLARLYVDPDFPRRLFEADPNAGNALPDGLRDYLNAIDYVAMALEWRDGFLVSQYESIDPDRLPDRLRAWAASSEGTTDLVDRVPASALAVCSAQLDLPFLMDAILDEVPDAERPQIELLEIVLQGILLGRDVVTDVLPALGPGMLAYVVPPDEDEPISHAVLVGAVKIGDASGVVAALDNALRTALAFYALDSKNRKADLRLTTTQPTPGLRVTALARAETPQGPGLVYAFGEGVLVLGTQVDAVASYLKCPRSESERSHFQEFRKVHFPDAHSFLFIDLDAAYRVADARRDALARALARKRGESSPESASEDLDQVLSLLRLFRSVYATSEIAADFSMAKRTVGILIAE